MPQDQCWFMLDFHAVQDGHSCPFFFGGESGLLPEDGFVIGPAEIIRGRTGMPVLLVPVADSLYSAYPVRRKIVPDVRGDELKLFVILLFMPVAQILLCSSVL